MKDDDDDSWLDDRASGSVPPEVRERAIRQVCDRVAAETAPRDAWLPAPPPYARPEGAPPPTQQGPTLPSPPVSAASPAANDLAQPRASGVHVRPVMRAPAFLAGTMDLPDGAGAPAPVMPFRPALPVPPPPGPPPVPAGRTVASRVLAFAETTDLAQSIPQPGATVSPFPAGVPPLTSRQYACLCAHLTLQPERAAEILVYYQVRGDTARAALEAYWRWQHAWRPDVRAAFEQDFASYTAWLRATGT